MFLAILEPDGDTLVFITPAGPVFGRLSDPTTFRPLATGVPLGAPVAVTAADFLVYTWTGSEPYGTYVVFLAAVEAATGNLLGLSTASFALAPSGANGSGVGRITLAGLAPSFRRAVLP